jgi:hypothetical protein
MILLIIMMRRMTMITLQLLLLTVIILMILVPVPVTSFLPQEPYSYCDRQKIQQQQPQQQRQEPPRHVPSFLLSLSSSSSLFATSITPSTNNNNGGGGGGGGGSSTSRSTATFTMTSTSSSSLVRNKKSPSSNNELKRPNHDKKKNYLPTLSPSSSSSSSSSRRDQLRSVIRSIETYDYTQDDDEDEDEDDYDVTNSKIIIINNATTRSQQQQQQHPPPPYRTDPQLLAILRLLYHASTTKHVLEAGQELEELFFVQPTRTTTTTSSSSSSSSSSFRRSSTTATSTTYRPSPTTNTTKMSTTPRATTAIWNVHTYRPIQERIIKACALAGLTQLAMTLLQDLLVVVAQPPAQLQEEDNEDPTSSDDALPLPSSLAYTAVCDCLKRNGRCEQIEDLLLQLADVARRSSSSSSTTKEKEQKVHVSAFNTYLACLCQTQQQQQQQSPINSQQRHDNNNNSNSKRSSSVPSRQYLNVAWNYIQNDGRRAQDVFAIGALDITSYNTVLHGAATASNRTLADSIWKEMRDSPQQQQQQPTQKNKNKGGDNRMQLDIRSYNARLLSLKNNDPTERLQLFQELLLQMQKQQQQPPFYGNNKEEKKSGTPLSSSMPSSSFSTFDAVAEAVPQSPPNHPPLLQVQPDRFTIDLILVPLIQAGRIGDVENLLDDFVSSHSPNVVSDAFGAFFITLVQEGEMMTARALFETYVLPSLWSNGGGGASSSSSSSSSQPAGTTATTSSSSELIRQLEGTRIKFKRNSRSVSALVVRPTVKHFNVLMDGYRRLGDEYKKQEVFLNNREKEQQQSLPKTKGRQQQQQKLQEQQQKQLAENMIDDGSKYDSEEETMDPQLAWKEGQELYTLLTDHFHLIPDEYTVTSMMGLCDTSEELTDFLFRQQQQQQVRPQVDAVVRKSLSSSPAVLRAAMTAYGQVGDPSAACILFDRFGRGPATMNARTWNVLLGALAEGAKRDDVALKLNWEESPLLRAIHDWSQSADLVKESASQTNNDSSPGGSDRQDHVSFILSSLVGKTCTEAVQILLHRMRTPFSKAPTPNTQSYCIVASALQHGATTDASVAVALFRNATSADGMAADGRFVNAIFRCFGDDIQAALVAWKGEIRSACVAYEERTRNAPPSVRRSHAKNLIAAYNGLLYVCGRALRPDIAVRVAYAMNREDIEPNDVSLNCYHSGKRMRQQRLNKNKNIIIDDTNTATATETVTRLTALETDEGKDNPNDTVDQSSPTNSNNNNNRFGFVSEFGRKAMPNFLPKSMPKLLPQLDFVDQYENLLYVECTRYDRNDKRRKGDKRVRIII